MQGTPQAGSGARGRGAPSRPCPPGTRYLGCGGGRPSRACSVMAGWWASALARGVSLTLPDSVCGCLASTRQRGWRLRPSLGRSLWATEGQLANRVQRCCPRGREQGRRGWEVKGGGQAISLGEERLPSERVGGPPLTRNVRSEARSSAPTSEARLSG